MSATPPTPAHLLILGGTGDAASLAERALKRFGARLRVTSSLAGRTLAPRSLPGEVRSGGFGGVGGLVRYLASERIDMLIDATHPFAAHITGNARRACRRAGVPHLLLQRPPWTPVQGDDWIEVADEIEAKTKLKELGRPAFLALGTGELDAFRTLRGLRLVARVAEPPRRTPLPGAEIVVGRGPFREREEAALFRRLRIGVVVSRNSGGEASYGKIAAARKLGLPVVMIRRPPAASEDSVATVEEALAWIAERLET